MSRLELENYDIVDNRTENRLEVYDSGTGDLRFIVNDGGNIEFRNGGVDLQQNDISNVGALSTERHLTKFEEVSPHASDVRPLQTTKAQILYVDPNGGVDDARPNDEVTEANPLATLYEAMDRVPIFINHNFVIELADGQYLENGECWSAPRHFVGGYEHNPAPFRIVGNSNDNSQVVLNDVLNLALVGNEMDNAYLTDVTTQASIQNFDGHLALRNVAFEDGPNALSNRGFIAHNAGTTWLKSCSFGSGLTNAVELRDGHRCIMGGATGSVQGYAVLCYTGSKLSLTYQTTTLTGDHGFIENNRGGQFVLPDGLPVSRDARIVDDWDDGRLTDRFKASTGLYRPEWPTQEGSPSADEGYAAIPAGNSTTQKLHTDSYTSRMTTGEWRYEIAAQSSGSTGEFRLELMKNNGLERVYVKLTPSGGADIVKYDGSFVTLVNGAWPADTNRHDIRAVRSLDIDGGGNEGWELFVDGTSQGTKTDVFIPEPYEKGFYNTTDAEYRVYQMSERPL